MVGTCFRSGWGVLWLVVLLRVVRPSFFILRANYPLIIILHSPYFLIFHFFSLHYFCSLCLLYYLVCLRLSLLYIIIHRMFIRTFQMFSKYVVHFYFKRMCFRVACLWDIHIYIYINIIYIIYISTVIAFWLASQPK